MPHKVKGDEQARMKFHVGFGILKPICHGLGKFLAEISLSRGMYSEGRGWYFDLWDSEESNGGPI